MVAKLIRLRYAGTCSGCAFPLPSGTMAWWDAEVRGRATCVGCQPSQADESVGAPLSGRTAGGQHEDALFSLAAGIAGGSARQEYERRHQRRVQQIDERWGRLAGVAKFLSDDPQSTKAWAKGSVGEERLAAYLHRKVGEHAALLHDRKVPRTRGNIDHLAIATSGIWVIDAKHFKGMVERRDKGGWFKTDYHLYVGGRDRTTVVNGLGWQVDAVWAALSGTDVPINAAVCLIGTEWKLSAKPFRLNGVWVLSARMLSSMIAKRGPVTSAEVTSIAERLSRALPPAVRDPS